MRATVFGLDVRGDTELELLRGGQAAPTGRTLSLTVASQDALRQQWPGCGELVCDQRGPGGSAGFCIESHPRAGYLISGAEYGRHILAPDGQRALCMPGPSPLEVWQRLLIAQVLPFAALLHGLEALHASAVVIRGMAVAIAGPSRSGKTSVALELCRRGAGFLADDVLALQTAGDALLGQPGTPIVGLDHDEVRRVAQAHPREDRQIVAENAREQLVRVPGATGPRPLRALFYLDRRNEDLSALRFEPAADPQLLLGSSFNSVITTPARLRGLLDACALLARHRVERIVVGSGVDAGQVAAAIDRRLQSAP
jgi:hypothetical protein